MTHQQNLSGTAPCAQSGSLAPDCAPQVWGPGRPWYEVGNEVLREEYKLYMGVSKNRGIPKMDDSMMENPIF